MLNKSKILCLLPIIGDTKDSKRIEILQDSDFEVVVVAFERNSYKARMPNAQVNILAKINNGNYFKRIFIMMKCVLSLRKYIKNTDAIYALNQDLAIFAFISGIGLNKPLIIDVADIREIQTGPSIVSIFFRSIDKYITNRASLIVVTAKGFISEYYNKILGIEIEDYVLLENKVDYSDDLRNTSNTIEYQHEKIRIGYIGVLRDEWTLLFLKELVIKYPDKFEIVCAGIDLIRAYDIAEYCINTPGMIYLGPFKSPADLNGLFQEVDVIALFYPETKIPEHWFNIRSVCNTNRYYEACYFRKPIISFSFCEDGKRVKENSIGMVFDTYNIDSNVEILNSQLTKERIVFWHENLLHLKEDIYCFNKEKEIMKNKINEILR
jgi:succinoglycan biosynthesis protein ExoL